MEREGRRKKREGSKEVKSKRKTEKRKNGTWKVNTEGRYKTFKYAGRQVLNKN